MPKQKLYRIKPLVWKNINEDFCETKGVRIGQATAIFRLKRAWDTKEWSSPDLNRWTSNDLIIPTFRTLEKAKEAVQKHYESFIRALIEPL